MDFCLRGSQINLVTRQKAKPKYSSQTSLNLTHIHFRPRSASIHQRKQRCSPLFCRPQSADPRFGRHLQGSACGHYCSELTLGKVGKHSKRLQSVSSQDLLKLLLDEPIKRSWLCRSAGERACGYSNSSPDEQSSICSARKTTVSYTRLNKRTRIESGDISSIEGDSGERQTQANKNSSGSRVNATTIAATTHSATAATTTTSKMSGTQSTLPKEKPPPTFNLSSKLYNKDYWPSANTTSSYSSSLKPDLPGRVSFSKPNLNADHLDSSDCDNDKQEQHYKSSVSHESISAPGPVTVNIPKFSFSSHKEDTNESHSAGSLKKSVHFGSKGADGEAVLAETYEYPKCPSENCSCSTRSSSTGSVQDGIDTKCACDSPTCRFLQDSEQQQQHQHDKDLTTKARTSTDQQESVKTTTKPASPSEELNVIRAYKDAVGKQLENSIVKNLLEENGKAKPSTSSLGTSTSISFTTLNNNIELSSYLDKYGPLTHSSADYQQEKQNNLSEPKTSPSSGSSSSANSSKHSAGPYKSSPKSNLPSSSLPADNNLLPTTASSKSNFNATSSSSTESVINNYLKVTSSAPFTAKKKENTLSTTLSSTMSHKKTLKPQANSASSTKPKAGSTSSNGSKLKKAISFGSLREDSNLDEFNLDKIDSWMSLRERKLNVSSGNLAKHGSLNNELEKYSGKPKYGMGLDMDDDLGDTNSQVSSKSDENSQDDSTYDEIVSVIKEIDDDKRQDNFAERAASEMDLKLTTSSSMSTARTENDNEKSEDKYKDILSYLDDVEDSCDKTLLETRRSMPDTNRTEVEFIVEPDIVEDVPKLSDLLMLPNHQLARRVIALSLRANELSNAIHLSKEHVFKIRSEKQKSVRAEKANGVNRLREQKKHYESVVQRHQGFIEQLLKDKGSLCEKVAALTRRLESQNQAWEHKLESELARVKETTLAGEKIRRERWVRENTKKIKELTVKGLEAEINKMSSNHQRVITELKREHQEELLNALEEARIKHEQIEKQVRESCAQDREAIIEKERAAIRERFERQLEEEHKALEELKLKLGEDHESERARLQAELKSKEMEHQVKRAEMQQQFEEEMEQMKNELLEKMSKQDEKYQNRINTIEKQFESDFEIWKREYENNCKMAQVEKENSIRSHYRAERDRQIDAIVSRMDAEALKNAEEYENKLSRMKEKFEKDLQDAENVEKSMREKYAETRNKLGEADAQVRNQQAELKQLQMELEHSKKMCSDYINERDQLRENLRNEIQNEVATLKNERDQEIQKIHKRVQQAIEKKDATIDILQKENGSLRERCLKLEQVIRQQRKDYCVK